MMGGLVELNNLTITKALELLARGELTSLELTKLSLERIRKVDPEVKAFLYVNEEWALEQAKEADKRRREGQPGRLIGVPLSIKDNILVKGHPTTCASKILQNYVAPYDATVITRLKREGAVFLGKTNLDEFAMGSSTENSAFYPTKNPWDVSRVPGGSSGGSAVAVACRMGLGSLGSDTGGSIRQPASFCGVVGIKPTYGLVSRFGLVAFASSLDQIGPLALTVEDAAFLLDVISGPDPWDSTSCPQSKTDLLENLSSLQNTKFKVGIPKEYLLDGLDGEVEKNFVEMRDLLKQMGHEVKEVSLPHTKHAVAVYYILAPAEASSNLARYDGVKYGLRVVGKNLLEMYKKSRAEGFGREVKRRIMLGTYALSAGYYEAFYLKASKVRTLIMQDFLKAFQEVDLLVTPVSPTPPFKLGEKTADPLQMYLSDIFTIPVNLAGLPGLSLPSGFSQEGLPLGLQIIGPHFKDTLVLALAQQIERTLGLHPIPPLIKGL